MRPESEPSRARLASMVTVLPIHDETLKVRCVYDPAFAFEYVPSVVVVEPSTTWTNMMLQPPPPHAVDLLARASARQELADRIAQGFDEPSGVLPLFADPARAAAA